MANTRSRTINYTAVLVNYNIRRLHQTAKIASLILQILWSFRISHKKNQNDSLYSPQITNISTLKHTLPRQTAIVSPSPRKRLYPLIMSTIGSGDRARFIQLTCTQKFCLLNSAVPLHRPHRKKQTKSKRLQL